MLTLNGNLELQCRNKQRCLTNTSDNNVEFLYFRNNDTVTYQERQQQHKIRFSKRCNVMPELLRQSHHGQVVLQKKNNSDESRTDGAFCGSQNNVINDVLITM